MSKVEEYVDVVVVGAGHAGCEAALACARLGMQTALFTVSVDSIALMPCNPNIGGSSKGHLVREIDALGGEMGKNIDRTFIQSKMLNKSKGPAVHSLRAQADKSDYSRSAGADGQSDDPADGSDGADRGGRRFNRCQNVLWCRISLQSSNPLYRYVSESKMHLRGCERAYRAERTAGGKLSYGFSKGKQSGTAAL